MNDTVLFEAGARPGVATAILNRPRHFNCVNGDMIAALHDTIDQCESDPAIRVLVLRANGDHFCTGADLDDVLRVRQSSAQLRQFIEAGHQVLRRLEMLPMPVIGLIHGLALAGGLELALACDVVFMAGSAQLGDQHARFGLIPGWGGSQRLPRLIGQRRALDLMFSGRWLTADQAQQWGLANYVVDDDSLESDGMDYAGQLAGLNGEGLAAMKRLALTGSSMPLADGLQQEIDCAVEFLQSANVTEGLAAFRGKRPPKFG